MQEKQLILPQGNDVETVCLLSKLHEAKHHINVKVDMDELDLTSAEAKATYKEIEKWVQKNYGFHVTNLNIAQVKHDIHMETIGIFHTDADDIFMSLEIVFRMCSFKAEIFK